MNALPVPAAEDRMLPRLLLVSLTLSALAALGSEGSAQLVVSTSKTTYGIGEPIFVGEKLVNATMLPVPYSTRTAEGTNATIEYRIHRLDPENRAVQTPAFKVERNGTEVLDVRTIHVHAVSSGFSGEIGPGRSSTMGGTLGFGVPMNLLVAPPATTGAYVELVTATNQVVSLSPGDRITIAAGTYQVTALVDDVQIAGYWYDRSTTGYLVAETCFEVGAAKRTVQLGGPEQAP